MPHPQPSEPSPPEALPVDSDVDLRQAGDRGELARAPWAVLAAIAAGGGAGSLARYALGVAFPPTAGGFPTSTFLINVAGSLLIGVLMVLVQRVWPGRRLVRPLFGVGLLGGFTTYSFHSLEIMELLAEGAPGTAAGYAAASATAAVAAVALGIAVTGTLVRRARPGRTERDPAQEEDR